MDSSSLAESKRKSFNVNYRRMNFLIEFKHFRIHKRMQTGLIGFYERNYYTTELNSTHIEAVKRRAVHHHNGYFWYCWNLFSNRLILTKVKRLHKNTELNISQFNRLTNLLGAFKTAASTLLN